MIRALGRTGDGRPLLLIGLSAENTRRLMDDQPIAFNTTEMAEAVVPGMAVLPDIQVIIVAGETETDIVTTLKAASLLADEATPG